MRGLSYLALGSFSNVASELGTVLAARPPFGVVDAPPTGVVTTYQPGSDLSVRGWVIDTIAVGSVDVEIDGTVVATVPVNQQRDDVCAIYPAYGGCPSVGFNAAVSTAGLDGCQHLLRVRATDGDGNAQVLGERVIEPS